MGVIKDNSTSTFYSAQLILDNSGVLSVQFYESATAMVTPFAISTSDGAEVAFSYPWK